MAVGEGVRLRALLVRMRDRFAVLGFFATVIENRKRGPAGFSVGTTGGPDTTRTTAPWPQRILLATGPGLVHSLLPIGVNSNTPVTVTAGILQTAARKRECNPFSLEWRGRRAPILLDLALHRVERIGADASVQYYGCAAHEYECSAEHRNARTDRCLRHGSYCACITMGAVELNWRALAALS